MSSRTRHVCPICAKESRPRPDNAAYPFCSPPCKLVDLGAWLDGNYRIPGPPIAMEEHTHDGDLAAPADHRGTGQAGPDQHTKEDGE